MKVEKPAQGVLLLHDWGHSKMYKAVCECTSDDCTHTIDVEADDHDVTVTIYTTQRTNFWSKHRWQHLWKLLIKGYTEFEASIVLKKQVALNYANVLQSAVKDVEELKNARKNQRSDEHPQ